jgi:hypothetical protein
MDTKQAFLPAFGPGQKGLLAQQMNQGFGGGQKQWAGLLGQQFQPTAMPDMVYGAGLTSTGKDAKGPYEPSKEEMNLYRAYANLNTSGRMDDANRYWAQLSAQAQKYFTANPPQNYTV